jgi:glucose/arabinose dehydrogenase
MFRMVSYALLLFASGAVFGQTVSPTIPHRQDRPPNEPCEPAEALKRMTVAPGFKVELVASEPTIVNPIAMAFDDRGRIWITESVEYPRKSAGPGRDTVKVLEDTQGNGRFDKITTFTEGLNIPTGVAVGYGGVWILNAPDLLFCREKDGKEVSREVVLTGFGRTDTHELPNSLTWGPDGWLYGLNGVFNHCKVKSPFSPNKVFEFTCALWRVHPRTHEFQVFCEGTSNPYGLVWDPEGSALVSACHWATDHVFHFVETGYYQRQAGAYPPFTIPIGSITNHSHQKTAYCGLCYFDSDTYPEKYRHRLYMGNIHGGCINADVLRRAGSTYLAEGEPDFLTANDAWFMPVSQKLGPDGRLYILDWYDRYHCSQDAARDPQGVDRLRGRLYRVRYGNTPPAGRFDLGRESDDALIQRLYSRNLFYCQTAQRLLTERDAPELRGKLEKLVEDGTASRKARLHALWALIGTGKLNTDFHLRLLKHADPTFRAWGVRAAGNFGSMEKLHHPLRDDIEDLATDPSPDVLLQVAITARRLDSCSALTTMVNVLNSCGQDKLIPLIVWPNIHPLLDELGSRFVWLFYNSRKARTAPGVIKLLPHVIERMLSRKPPDTASVAELVGIITDPHAAPVKANVPVDVPCARASLAVISAKARGLGRTDLEGLKKGMQPILAKILAGEAKGPLYWSAHLLAAQLQIGDFDGTAVRRLFLAPDQPEGVRLQALEALVTFRDPGMREAVGNVLASGSPPFLSKVLDVLGRGDDPKVAGVILDHYAKMSPELQPLAIELLMQRKAWTAKLLDAVLKKRLPASALNVNQLRRILDGNDREAVWAIEKAYGAVRSERNPQREQVVVEMTKYLRAHPGDPKAGRLVSFSAPLPAKQTSARVAGLYSDH